MCVAIRTYFLMLRCRDFYYTFLVSLRVFMNTSTLIHINRCSSCVSSLHVHMNQSISSMTCPYLPSYLLQHVSKVDTRIGPHTQKTTICDNLFFYNWRRPRLLSCKDLVVCTSHTLPPVTYPVELQLGKDQLPLSKRGRPLRVCVPKNMQCDDPVIAVLRNRLNIFNQQPIFHQCWSHIISTKRGLYMDSQSSSRRSHGLQQLVRGDSELRALSLMISLQPKNVRARQHFQRFQSSNSWCVKCIYICAQNWGLAVSSCWKLIQAAADIYFKRDFCLTLWMLSTH